MAAAEVAETLDTAEASLEAHQHLIEMLNAKARLTVESGQKIICAACWSGEGVFALRPSQL